MILYSQVFMSALPPGVAVFWGTASVAKSGVPSPSHRLGRVIRDHAIAADRAQALPIGDEVRCPRDSTDAALAQRSDHVAIDVVVIGKAPRGAEARGVGGDVHD